MAPVKPEDNDHATALPGTKPIETEVIIGVPDLILILALDEALSNAVRFIRELAADVRV
jgi:hypothetical protein